MEWRYKKGCFTIYKSCSRCGKIHKASYKCPVNRVYNGGIERDIRNTYEWHKKAKQIKRESNYLCEVCKQEGRYTYNNLEVHHIIKVKDDTSRLLDDYNLVCLCVEHHKKADNGEISKEYLEELARNRVDKT